MKRMQWMISLGVGLLLLACTGTGTSTPGPNSTDQDPDLETVDSGIENPSVRDASISWSDAGNSMSMGETCETLRVEATASAPQVMIVLDQSGSMTDEGRWGPAVHAINTLVGSLEHEVAFGLTAFGTHRSCGSVSLVTGAKLRNAAAIANYLNTAVADGPTPTAEALRRVAEEKRIAIAAMEASQGTPDGEGYQGVSSLILVTDGAPNCNYDLDVQTCACSNSDPEVCARVRERATNGTMCLDDSDTIAAIDDLRTLGVETYVVGYETSEWADLLTRMARSGSDRPYVSVENASQLEPSLREVATGLESCSFSLEQGPADATYVRVHLNGEEVSHASQTEQGGWALEGKTVSLLGQDCDRARNDGSATLEISVECEPVFFLR